MGADLASDNNPDRNRDNGDTADFHIPSPRPPADDHIDGLPEHLSEIGSDTSVWWYDQPRKRGEDRRYWGEVEWIGGPEGDQLREKLNDIVRDLLQWAHDERKKSETDSSVDSGEDGDTDDTPA
jgi:hypothetical protein